MGLVKLLITLGLYALHLFSNSEGATERVANPDKIVKVNAVDEQLESGYYETYEITAYTAGRESTGKSPGDPSYGITASGEKVEENFTAACPKSMDFGTRLYIPYFKNTYVCTDRGGAITEGKIDIYMRHLDDALDFGRRDLEVRVIKKEVSN
jgi:3D (Asp-Asp-Asp) domain-containing protein